MAVIFYVFLLIFKIRRISLLPLPGVSLTTILVDPYREAPPIDKVQEKNRPWSVQYSQMIFFSYQNFDFLLSNFCRRFRQDCVLTRIQAVFGNAQSFPSQCKEKIQYSGHENKDIYNAFF